MESGFLCAIRSFASIFACYCLADCIRTSDRLLIGLSFHVDSTGGREVLRVLHQDHANWDSLKAKLTMSSL